MRPSSRTPYIDFTAKGGFGADEDCFGGDCQSGNVGYEVLRTFSLRHYTEGNTVFRAHNCEKPLIHWQIWRFHHSNNLPFATQSKARACPIEANSRITRLQHLSPPTASEKEIQQLVTLMKVETLQMVPSRMAIIYAEKQASALFHICISLMSSLRSINDYLHPIPSVPVSKPWLVLDFPLVRK